ncbi:DSD1 family PLP-dependent enzyme [Marinivivus vitaminiproducens]|uniref:DSD1 family PLP-dependent enzyme n=1 Tax=Marinivivus vitaminiproducens TaxID=3035935 RepID=UPI0027A3A5E4|nr:DSD1 family PLP-dependent enzyme [Geminicoccaceae bacterium SCSIO 64248]
MVMRCPAEIGMSEAEVDTPALLVDLDAYEANLRLMAELTEGKVRVRPHAKTHKSPVIALHQIAQGAVGMCCQKVDEAIALVDGGVRDVLVSNQVVGAAKVLRLAALARRARIGVCVDAREQVEALAEAVERMGSSLDVLVEIDVGSRRCGVEPGEPALRLAERVEEEKGLRFGGLQAYYGSAQHIRDPGERREAVKRAAGLAGDTVLLLDRYGLRCDTVGGAGTGTFADEIELGAINEIQPGSYIFMDGDYRRNRVEGAPTYERFAQSLFVLSTVMSTRPEHAVTDAGLKALSVDSGLPDVHARSGSLYTGASDEHGVITHADGRPFQLGERVRLIPGHCDPTVNLYDWYVGVRTGRVEAIWPIPARGALH